MPKPKRPRLLVEERRRRLMEIFDSQERATVDELVTSRFGVSAVTIRGDLDALAAMGAIVQSHGGALKRIDASDIPITVKETLHHPEKIRIAQAAVAMIRDGETIILDSGTTTVEIAREIKKSELRALNLITNALNIAMELANMPARVIIVGGLLRPLAISSSAPAPSTRCAACTPIACSWGGRPRSGDRT